MKIVDTDILLDHFHGNQRAVDFVASHAVRDESLSISAISVAEVMGGMRSGEERRTALLLNQFEVIDVDAGIARQAGRFLSAYRNRRIDLTDAIIAATAYLNGLDIVTRNTRHYPMPEVLVIEPYRRGEND
jgi:predicted nucleic acid-binding protein